MDSSVRHDRRTWRACMRAYACDWVVSTKRKASWKLMRKCLFHEMSWKWEEEERVIYARKSPPFDGKPKMPRLFIFIILYEKLIEIHRKSIELQPLSIVWQMYTEINICLLPVCGTILFCFFKKWLPSYDCCARGRERNGNDVINLFGSVINTSLVVLISMGHDNRR